MKLIAHDVFNFGLGACILARLGAGVAVSVLLALVISFAVNRIIDAGHIQKHGRPTRSYITHSVFTAPAWGAAVGIAIGVVVALILHVDIVAPAAIIGIIGGYAHLLLDAVTEGGVFIWKRRIALAHWRYNSPAANGLAMAVGVLLLVLALEPHQTAALLSSLPLPLLSLLSLPLPAFSTFSEP